ncbi:MAG: hypothetical protein AAGB22_01375, partial [Bacteroidota bacterium]
MHRLSAPLHTSLIACIALCAGLLATPFHTQATHLVGGSITYRHVGIDSLEVRLVLYRDCQGISLGIVSQSVSFNPTDPTCNSGQSFVVQLPWQSTVEVSQLCPSQVLNSTCNGGLLAGAEEFTYLDTVWLGDMGNTSTARCDRWNITWTSCCRSTAIDNLVNPGGQGFVIEAELDNVHFPTNSSPIFTAPPMPMVCLFNPVTYNPGVIEPDGDQLVYSMIAAQANPLPGVPIAYVAPYTATAPLPGFQLDSTNGTMSFTPTTMGSFTVVVQVDEYDASGTWKGRVIRDFQFVVQNCTNAPPGNPGGIVNLNGAASLLDSTTIQVCGNSGFCISIPVNDADTANLVSAVSTFSSLFPNAVINITGTNPIMISLCSGTNTLPPGEYFFFVAASDDACPVTGTTWQAYRIQKQGDLDAGPDRLVCNSGGVQLSALGGSSFTWSVLSGDPMVVGSNFSCDTCFNPVANPSISTTYLVTSNVQAVCPGQNFNNIDTVTVFRGGGWDLTGVTAPAGDCGMDSSGTIAIQTNLSIPLAYSLQKDGGIPQVQSSPTFGGLTAGQYIINVVDSVGCAERDTVIIDAWPKPSINGSAFPANCLGDSSGWINLQGSFGGVPPLDYSFDGGATFSSGFGLLNAAVGTYFLVVRDANGCTDDTVVVVSEPPPVVISVSNDVTLPCPGDTVALLATASGGNSNNFDFIWSPNTGSMSGNPLVSPTVPTTYTVFAQNSSGCTSEVDSIRVDMPDPVTVNLATLTMLPGDTITYCAQVSGGVPPFSYNWNTGSTDSCIAVNLEDDGIFTVAILDACGQVDTATAEISVAPVSAAFPTQTGWELRAYPNPYTAQTTIALTLSEAGAVELEVVDLLGQRVQVLQQGMLGAGRHTFTFSAHASG